MAKVKGCLTLQALTLGLTECHTRALEFVSCTRSTVLSIYLIKVRELNP